VGKVSIVIPEATINKVLNPSCEIAGNFAAYNAGVVQRVTTNSLYGNYEFSIAAGAINRGASFTLDTLTNAIHYVTLRTHGDRNTIEVSTNAVNWHEITNPTATPLERGSEGWLTWGVQIPAAQCNGQTTLYLRYPIVGANGVDGIQVERKDYWTTYCDADQPGCEPIPGDVPHATPSQRSAQAGGGGRVIDLDDYNVSVDVIAGAGFPPLVHNILNFALGEGASMRGEKVKPRPLTLRCHTVTQTEPTQYDARKAIIDAIKGDRVATLQPVSVRFSGESLRDVEIGAYYSDGLQGIYDTTCYDEFDIVLMAYSPFWNEIGEASTELGIQTTLTVRYIAGRVNGEWDDLSVGAGGGTIRAIAIGPDGNIYVGGTFATIDGVANTSRIAMYNPSTDAWTPLGTGAANNSVLALVFGPDGTLYAGGDFTAMGGVGNTRGIAYWDGAAWNAMGTGAGGGGVLALAVGLGGAVFAGGDFTAMGGLAGTTGDYIARWRAGAWGTISSDVNGGACAVIVLALTVGLDGTLYAGGNFTTIDGVTVNAIGRMGAGDVWTDMDGGEGVGICNPVQAIAIAPNGRVIIGGDFANMGSSDIEFIAEWTGATWIALGAGVNDAVYSLAYGYDGMLYAGGNFTEAGGLVLSDRVSRWNGYSWLHLDVDLPGAPTVTAIAIGHPDPVIVSNYDVYLGFNTNGNATIAIETTVDNSGTRSTYPELIFINDTGATVVLKTTRNEATGEELLFNFALLNGETLTVNVETKEITSTFRGKTTNALLPGSDFSIWHLMPGENDITAFAQPGTAPTVFAKRKHRHYDPAGAQ